MDLSAYINFLLVRDGKVTLPGIGQFQANYLPAQALHVEGKMKPPRLSVKFDPEEDIDHARHLARIISRQEGMATEDAQRQIEKLVREIRSSVYDRKALKPGRDWQLSGLGRLHADIEGTMLFTLDEETNLLPSSYGLPVIRARMLIRKDRSKKATREVTQTSRTAQLSANHAGNQASEKKDSHPSTSVLTPAVESAVRRAARGKRVKRAGWLYWTVLGILLLVAASAAALLFNDQLQLFPDWWVLPIREALEI